MSLASALIKKVIEEKNIDTWSNLKRIYLPVEFHSIHSIIDSHVDTYFKLPTFEELKFEVRDRSVLDKISIIETEEVEAESFMLLDYLKSEFTQKELISGLDRFLDSSIAFSSAEDAIEEIYGVISQVENKVDLVKPKDSIERVELFDSDEEMEASLRLGLNAEFDAEFMFPSTSLVLIGGYRGSGKSIVCNNIAQTHSNEGKTAIKFCMEMSVRQELQRQCAIATQVPHRNIRFKDLSVAQWDKVAQWWASRYVNGYDIYEQVYLKDHDFRAFHKILTKDPVLAQPAIDFVHAPEMTLAKFRAETLKRLSKYDNVGVILVDYLNKMKVNDFSSNKFDWIDQIQVADGLKTFAEEIGIPIVSPFQTKADGGVKFSKDILVPADAAFTLSVGDDFMAFECIKTRHDSDKGFTSVMNWQTLTVGPETAIPPLTEDEDEESPQDL